MKQLTLKLAVDPKEITEEELQKRLDQALQGLHTHALVTIQETAQQEWFEYTKAKDKQTRFDQFYLTILNGILASEPTSDMLESATIAMAHRLAKQSLEVLDEKAESN